MTIAISLLLSACTDQPPRAPAPTVLASAETEPVPGYGDAAEDPAGSLVTGTDNRMNSVDLRDGFERGGHSLVLVVASDRDRSAIALYAFSPGRANRPR